MSDKPNSKIRYVVFHLPGDKWQKGVDFREQDGIAEHAAYYMQFHQMGKLEMGGPFTDADRGGMMVAIAGVSREELDDYASKDPAIKSGLLRYEIAEWYLPFSKSENE